MVFLDYLHRAAAGDPLGETDAEQAMSFILEGAASVAQVAAFLVALRMRELTAEVLTGFARAMRAKCHRVDPGGLQRPLLDTCGTGGDALGTFNISTAAALVCAGAGAAVAKHGNRSISSRSGSADVMEALGVNIALTPDQMAVCLREAGMAFLFAPALHPAMKHAQPARLELKMPTVFNLLGPLANPAGAPFQLIGASDPALAELMAQALARLGALRAFVVHGQGGLDEISISGPTTVYEVARGVVRTVTVVPEEFGLTRAGWESLRASGPVESAERVRSVLRGDRGPHRDIVVANAAAGLAAAGVSASLLEAAGCAVRSIDSGAALGVLESLARVSQSFAAS